jgi:hypothetical protein
MNIDHDERSNLIPSNLKVYTPYSQISLLKDCEILVYNLFCLFVQKSKIFQTLTRKVALWEHIVWGEYNSLIGPFLRLRFGGAYNLQIYFKTRCQH